MTFTDWAMKHCQTFGLLDEREVAMVLSWREPLCEIGGYTLTELFDATAQMAARTAPKFRSDHLRMIQERIMNVRLAIAAKESQERLEDASREDRGVCAACFSSGFMFVPHPAAILNGVWIRPWYEMAVLCRCALGRHISMNEVTADSRAMAEADEKRKPRPKARARQTIEAYERINPLWEGQMQERAKQHAALHKATEQARHADTQRGPLSDVIKRVLSEVSE